MTAPLAINALATALDRTLSPAESAVVIARILDRAEAPVWVRRCMAANHTVTLQAADFTMPGWRWFCTTCGKDRP